MARVTVDVWERALERLRQSIGEGNVRAWLAKSRLEENSEEASLTLAVPNEFYRRWISRRYLTQIRGVLSELMDTQVDVTLSIQEDLENGKPERATPTERGRAAAAQVQPEIFNPDEFTVGDNPTPVAAHRATSTTQTSPSLAFKGYNRLNPRYRLEEFIVGESNRYAHAAAIALTETRGRGFHPLFIYGGTGLGKTHLMQGIGHRMLERDASLKVLYVTSEQFINHFIDSIQHRRSHQFRSYYRNADILFIDDVQFLMGKDKSQTEFFHTFNSLCEEGRKVVVTSDKPPRELQQLEDRLRSRFEWGLLVDIQPPDLETRIAILRKKAELERFPLPNDVAMFVGERITDNVRELEGVLSRLRIYSTLHNRPVDLALAREVVGKLPASEARHAITVEDVQRAVCEYFHVRAADMLGKNRSKKFSRPRHIAQFLCRRLTGFSFPDIALKFGGKDHTSVIYACRKIEGASRTDPALANILAHIEERIVRGQGSASNQ